MKVQYFWSARGICRGLRPSDQALPPEAEPPIGSHIMTPRRTYTHHGIYVGHRHVVQYGGLFRGLAAVVCPRAQESNDNASRRVSARESHILTVAGNRHLDHP
jgi:hypothetical protein